MGCEWQTRCVVVVAGKGYDTTVELLLYSTVQVIMRLFKLGRGAGAGIYNKA